MEAGADAMVTPCPLCHLSLDAWQQKLERPRPAGSSACRSSTSRSSSASPPGFEESELKFKRHVVSGRRRSSRSSRSEAERSGRARRRRRRRDRRPRLGAVRGRPGCGSTSSRSRCPGCRPSSPGCGSRTSPTSTSACRRPASRAVERAVDWVAERQPDLVLVTGDLLARPAGAERLRALIERLPPVYAVLGNHDYADSRDPFSKPVGEVDLGRGTLLSDEAVTLELRGRRVQLVGVDPRTYMRMRGAAVGARRPRRRPAHPALPLPARRRPAARRARSTSSSRGHMHDGQICLPYGRGKVRLAHPRAPYNHGLYRPPGGGAARLVRARHDASCPFRFFARPGGDGARRYNRRDGRPREHLARRPRALRGRRGARGRRRARARREPPAPAPAGADRGRRGRARSRSSCTSRSSGARRSPRSGRRCRSASPSTSRGWPTPRPARVDVVVDEVGPVRA